MAVQMKVDPNLHQSGFEDRIRHSYAGMAHFAGTGPAGKACRHCRFWLRNTDSFNRNTAREAYCTYALPGKAQRLVPGSAEACRFFEAEAKK